MKISAHQRLVGLIALLTLALTATAWVRDTDKATVSELVEAPSRVARPARTAETGQRSEERVALEKLRGPGMGGNAADPFAPRSWHKPVTRPVVANVVRTVAPQPSPAAPPQPSPTAPPLPFVYIGKVLSEEITAVFLMQGDRNLVVREGDVIDSIYRVERLANSDLTLTHLPTGIQQTLLIGEPR